MAEQTPSLGEQNAALRKLETAVRFLSVGIAPTPAELTDFKLALVTLRCAHGVVLGDGGKSNG